MRFANPRRLLVSGFATALAIGLIAPAAMAETVEVLAVTASSSDGMLMDAVDGESSTFWQNKGNEREAWIAVRFETPVMLRGVRLITGELPDRVLVAIETSPEGERYTPQLRDLRLADDRPVELGFARPVEALYVRVRFHYTGNGTPPRFRLAELEALKAR